MNKRILLSSPHMGGMERRFIDEAFESNWIAPVGSNIDNFEKELAEYVGVKGGVALVSGTAAIHLALKCVGIKAGDRVFCSSLTFIASCNPILYEGGTPIFIDSEPNSLNISNKALRKAFKSCEIEREETGLPLEKFLPKAVIVVNLYGQSANLGEIKEICDEYNVPIIEDAAESLGANYGDKKSGTIGEYGVYSFNGNKIITTSGGGMLVSNNIDMLKKAKFWSTQAKDRARHYQHSEMGYNYRMSNVVAGIGRGQLRVLNERIQQKKHIYNRYKEGFKELDNIEMMNICDYGDSNYWLSVALLSKESTITPLELIEELDKEDIEVRPIWKPMNLQPIYEGYLFYNHNDEGISVGEDIFNRGICLASDTKMTEEDIDRVINIVKRVLLNDK